MPYRSTARPMQGCPNMTGEIHTGWPPGVTLPRRALRSERWEPVRVVVEGVRREAKVAPPRPSASSVSTRRGPTAPSSCTAV